jgi:hypothetical protein
MWTRVAAFGHKHRRIITWLGLVAIGGLVLCEVGVRQLPPDTVRFEVQMSTNGGPTVTRTGVVTDPKTIARWRAAVSATPSGQLLAGTLMREWRGQDLCAPLGYFTASYVFLWHGIVVESVSSLSVCTEEYMISSGGLPDPHTYFVPLLAQP